MWQGIGQVNRTFKIPYKEIFQKLSLNLILCQLSSYHSESLHLKIGQYFLKNNVRKILQVYVNKV